MSHYIFESTPTPTSGYWADTTENVFPSHLSHILVSSATDTTVFDIKISDSKSRVIQEITDATGLYNGTDEDIPTLGVHTIEIDNATADEAFNVKIVFDEGH